jgi:hypothetical protein
MILLAMRMTASPRNRLTIVDRVRRHFEHSSKMTLSAPQASAVSSAERWPAHALTAGQASSGTRISIGFSLPALIYPRLPEPNR